MYPQTSYVKVPVLKNVTFLGDRVFSGVIKLKVIRVALGNVTCDIIKEKFDRCVEGDTGRRWPSTSHGETETVLPS